MAQTAPKAPQATTNEEPLDEDEFIWTSPPLQNPTALTIKIQNYEQSALHCPICQQFFTNAVTLKCQHAFCSECIRRGMGEMQSRRRERCCPVCNEKVVGNLETNLVPCWALQVAVNQYKAMRGFLYQNVVRGVMSENNGSNVNVDRNVEKPSTEENVQKEPKTANGKQIRINDESDEKILIDNITTGRPRRTCRNQNNINYEDEEDTQPQLEKLAPNTNSNATSMEDQSDSNSTPTMSHESASIPTKAALPMEEPSATATYNTSIMSLQSTLSTAIESRSTNTMRPIAMISLHGIKKKKLTSLLAKYDIPTHGSDQDRKNRYKQFIDLWNSECSAMHPRSTKQLVEDLMKRLQSEKVRLKMMRIDMELY